MGFVGNQDDAMLAKVFKGQGVFLFAGQVGVEFLNRRKADVDVGGIDRFKVLHWRNPHAAIANDKFLVEQIFDGSRVEKVVFGLFDDVGGIDKEQEVAIPLLVEIIKPAMMSVLPLPVAMLNSKCKGYALFGKSLW